MSQWFKVHYRNRTYVLAHGEEERDRLMKKKAPKAVHWEEALEYTCETCGAVSAWPSSTNAWKDVDNEWRWFGPRSALEAGAAVRIFCSKACEPEGLDRNGKKRPEGVDWADWPHICVFEPVNSSNWQVLDLARKNADPRHFPFPVFPDARTGPGWCRWCGDEILDHKGKNAGNRSNRRTWHRLEQGDATDCYFAYVLHMDRDIQATEIMKRDGPGCAICGPGGGKWVPQGYRSDKIWLIAWSQKLEVDHIMPLWRRWEFDSIEDQRAMFGLDNLWLLCPTHHKAKSAREASERAEERR